MSKTVKTIAEKCRGHQFATPAAVREHVRKHMGSDVAEKLTEAQCRRIRAGVKAR